MVDDSKKTIPDAALFPQETVITPPDADAATKDNRYYLAQNDVRLKALLAKHGNLTAPEGKEEIRLFNEQHLLSRKLESTFEQQGRRDRDEAARIGETIRKDESDHPNQAVINPLFIHREGVKAEVAKSLNEKGTANFDAASAILTNDSARSEALGAERQVASGRYKYEEASTPPSAPNVPNNTSIKSGRSGPE